jgi:hypothetical protein
LRGVGLDREDLFKSISAETLGNLQPLVVRFRGMATFKWYGTEMEGAWFVG